MKYAIMFLVLMSVGCAKQGPRGFIGDTGSQGVQGLSGTSGESCSVSSLAIGSVFAPNGGTLITCPNGTSSVVLNGTQGESGTNGTNGTPGTVITPVQFCSNLPLTEYPNNFPEQGLCLSGNLYGVYWTGTQAFLSELPPGQYTSTSPNGCNFTVSDSCQVKQN